ncbi:hypothetical protein LPJ61_002129 [Coemansia biformis]|uniref:EamA domain-containing protein n=1 Tax=Coemansia biformis TaxID=1286918 RepID=A0A9W7YDM9_9FUNG|nr:hypothetical protein LPJ61_002129 [Coemansia biformis]
MATGARGRHAAGLGLLLCVVLIWVGSSFLVSNLFGEQEYRQPFFVTYVNTGSFSLYLVGAYLAHIRNGLRSPQSQQNHCRSAGCAGCSGCRATGGLHTQGPTGERSPLAPPLPRLTVRETVRLGLEFGAIWFAANVTQNASLAYTSVASSSILCSTSGLFTLLIGAAAGVERFTALRLGAVLASALGVYCVMEFGSREAGAGAAARPLAWVGDMLALLSAALYGCYVTLLKRRIGDESRLNTPLFFGSVGAANVVLLWPVLVLLHATGIETFQLPPSRGVWAMVLVNALVGTFLSDYLWLLAMLMTSPLIVTLGLSLTIPLSMAGDVLLKGLDVAPPYYAGALLVLAAFVAANLWPARAL